ncbi:MAG: hypothetical protein HUK26_04710 [Duodenibacillus sp.]|nr:hypothetical protein [Duodenibacillus sp.]
MTLRPDEGNVNFLDIKPVTLEDARRAVQSALDSQTRALECIERAVAHVRAAYPGDQRLIDGLEAARHHLQRNL